jgi:hypothetical protein
MKGLRIYAGGMPRFLLCLNLFLCLLVGVIITVGFLPPIFCAFLMVLGGFAFFNLKYVLSNSMTLSGPLLSCRYSGVSLAPFNLFSSPSIFCQLPIEGLSYVSLNNLRYLYKRVDLVSIGQLKKSLCPFSPPSSNLVSNAHKKFDCAVFVYGDGTSRVLYTSPFNRKSLLRLYQELEQGGVRIFA